MTMDPGAAAAQGIAFTHGYTLETFWLHKPPLGNLPFHLLDLKCYKCTNLSTKPFPVSPKIWPGYHLVVGWKVVKTFTILGWLLRYGAIYCGPST